MTQLQHLRLVYSDGKFVSQENVEGFNRIPTQWEFDFESGDDQLIFVATTGVEAQSFIEFLTRISPKIVLDLRPTPTFRFGNLSRQIILNIFDNLGCIYIDVPALSKRKRENNHRPSIEDTARLLSGILENNITLGDRIMFLLEKNQFDKLDIYSISNEIEPKPDNGWGMISFNV